MLRRRLAEDTRLSRRVALKALAPEVSHDPQRRERLRHEARAAAALSHVNIATVYALETIYDEPENVIRTATGVIKVLDFGVARIDGATGRLTGEHDFPGTTG